MTCINIKNAEWTRFGRSISEGKCLCENEPCSSDSKETKSQRAASSTAVPCVLLDYSLTENILSPADCQAADLFRERLDVEI